MSGCPVGPLTPLGAQVAHMSVWLITAPPLTEVNEGGGGGG